jgi:hypothetical protein
MIARPTRPGVNLAMAYGLPPDTPLNLVVSRGLNMHAINRAVAVKKQYDADHPPPAQAGAKSAGREPPHDVKVPPPPHV